MSSSPADLNVPEGPGSASGPPNPAPELAELLPGGRTELREGYAEVGDVKLHYVEAGEGPLLVLLHGFPEFWYGWRLQIKPLAEAGFRVVAPDTRGYNLSSKPEGFEAYGVDLLAADIRGLIEERGAKQSLYGIAVASPCCTWTFELSKRCPREFASAGSISRHSMFFTGFLRQSVVMPGPGPISNTESRSSISRSVHGRISSCIFRFQCPDRQYHLWNRFI